MSSVGLLVQGLLMMKNIGERFKNIRKILNKSQDEFAHSLGITKQAISNIEHSKSMPGIITMDKLLLKFDINLNYLISGVGNMFNDQQKIYKSLKNQLLSEVEAMLDAKGIK